MKANRINVNPVNDKSTAPYLRNLRAALYSDTNTITGEFDRGVKIVVSWEGNANKYTLKMGGATFTPGSATSCVIEDGIQNSVTLCLIAEYDDGQLYAFLPLISKTPNPHVTANIITADKFETNDLTTTSINGTKSYTSRSNRYIGA